MTKSGSRLRQIGWAFALVICLCIYAGLSFRVHAVKSEVLLAEREIIALQRETLMLETEFQARASQRQLADWNTIEFGFEAPRADQYLDSERQLASLSNDALPSAPAPVLLASLEENEGADDAEQRRVVRLAEAPMVSPITGKAVEHAGAQQDDSYFVEAFGDILADATPAGSARGRTLLSAEVAE